MALFGMMMWISSALETRAADDSKASGEKKSEPSKGGTSVAFSPDGKRVVSGSSSKLEGKEAPQVETGALNLTSVDPTAEGPIGDFKMSNYRGKNIMVLAFFKDPKDTESVDEFKALSGQMGAFKQNGAIIMGISNSPIFRERRLHNKEKVNFPLIGDESTEICKKYGVFDNGKVNRVTFIIDRKGIVRKVIDTKDPKKHADEVLDAVKNLKS
jgi:peroxiredoxin Q/BCP